MPELAIVELRSGVELYLDVNRGTSFENFKERVKQGFLERLPPQLQPPEDFQYVTIHELESPWAIPDAVISTDEQFHGYRGTLFAAHFEPVKNSVVYYMKVVNEDGQYIAAGFNQTTDAIIERARVDLEFGLNGNFQSLDQHRRPWLQIRSGLGPLREGGALYYVRKVLHGGGGRRSRSRRTSRRSRSRRTSRRSRSRRTSRRSRSRRTSRRSHSRRSSRRR